MGLDIAYAASIVRTDDDADEMRDFRGLRIYVGTPDKNHVDRADGLESGCYLTPQTHRFRAGSYGGYNLWREKLSLLGMGVMPRMVWINPDEFRGQPFYEIVNFSDCEGVFGPKTSAKLAEDFRAFTDRARAALGEYDFAVYSDFEEAFSVAAQGGAVVFA